MMEDEWGPWIEHDGKGCPVPTGTAGEAILRDERIVPFIAECGSTRGGPTTPSKNSTEASAWVWCRSIGHQYFGDEVILYRVRKPRGLTILERILAALPAPKERVQA